MGTTEFKPNEEQRRVIDFVWGDGLVLAPPGCGKTDVLTHRIIKAREDYDIPYEDMLCLTFTNRASREMQERVRMRIKGSTQGLFIGNLHRFCTRFLHENNLIRLDTSIIDEDDQIEILSYLLGREDDSRNIDSLTQTVVSTANVITKERFGFPENLIQFSRRRHPRRDNEIIAEYARKYIKFKQDNHIIDFDDIINLAYEAMLRPDFKRMRISNYRWIQIDEVQDLNPLQFAIIDKLTDPELHTRLYLGDERQAIFSFIGASLDGLQKHKQSMQVFNFDTNYRSPKYLVDFINLYAVTNFDVSERELPKASNDLPNDGGLVIFGCEDRTGHEQASLIVAQSRQLHWFSKQESIGILARTNNEIEYIADFLDKHHLEYLKLSRRDMFKMVDYKTLYSHFAIVANEHRNTEWSRILYQTGAVEKMSDARGYATKFRRAGISFTDMLRTDEGSYLQSFYDTLSRGEIVVFDTETTGLDTYNDDVIQISAAKMNNQGIIPGSVLNIIIETDKEIPETLGDGRPNPMRQVYDESQRTDFATAFRIFRDYVGDAPVLGHNVGFDVEILKGNVLRRVDTSAQTSIDFLDNCLDSLKAARLVDPELRSHGLEFMLKHYGIEGKNTHIGIDDVFATINLTVFLLDKIEEMLPMHNEILVSPGVAKLRRRLRTRYKSYYEHTLVKVHSHEISAENNLVSELEWLYRNMLMDNYIEAIPRFDYIVELFRKVLVKPESESYFSQQLANHVYEMRTFSESDLYNNGVVKECIHLMTIHKAKGLQFDNVFVFGIDRIPGPLDYSDDESKKESARVLYVAISRAKRRLYLCYDGRCSKFITEEMQQMFNILTPQQQQRLIQIESLMSNALDEPREE